MTSVDRRPAAKNTRRSCPSSILELYDGERNGASVAHTSTSIQLFLEDTMSARTTFLSKLIGLYLILISLAMIVHKQATVESMNALVHNAPVIVRSRCDCGGCWAGDGSRPQCLVRRRASGCRHPDWVADADQRLDAFVPVTGGCVRDASRGDSLPTAFLLVHGHRCFFSASA